MAEEEENNQDEGDATGEKSGIEYQLDEDGNPILDEDGNPIAVAKKSKKKLIIIILLLAILGGGGGAAYYTGALSSIMGGGEEESDPSLAPKTTYYDMEEFLVNLNNPGKKVSFLKMSITLVLPNTKTTDIITEKLPLIRDTFLIYLRELREEDLRGSKGPLRLKAELRLRINKVIEPQEISEILFKDIMVQ